MTIEKQINRIPAANNSNSKGDISCFAKIFSLAKSSVIRMMFSSKNSAHQAAAKRYL
jgi:hypothetical protein